MKTRRQSEIVQSAGIIRGKVTVESAQRGNPVVVVCFREQHGAFLLDCMGTFSPSVEEYEFDVFPGDYAVGAFVDLNGDGEHQEGEHGQLHLDPLTVTVREGETVTVDPLTISGAAPDLPADIEEADLDLRIENTGKVIPLDSPLFVRKNYSMGMWSPVDFLERVGGGLFFLQKFQADKTPVIFVHGINGGPHDWRSAVGELDTRRFQAWVLFYPSGVRLNMISSYLVEAIGLLKRRHGFDGFGVAAHSMGGLVTRSFVKKYVERFPEHPQDIRFVLTVNSPMGGMPSAASGVKLSPIVLPVWRDLTPSSEFLTDLNTWDWPREIPYHLVFSYKEGSSSDGTVSLRSQIPFRLQSEAVRVYGFNNDHVGTLNDEAFLELFDRILGETSGPAGESGGR